MNRKAEPRPPRGLVAMVLSASMAMSACAGTAGAVIPAPALVEETPDTTHWSEGRTWAGEIDHCAAVTDDASGCEQLADFLRDHRCELMTYQNFVAGMYIGGNFGIMYDDAVDRGLCLGPAEASAGGSVERASTPSAGDS